MIKLDILDCEKINLIEEEVNLTLSINCFINISYL